MPFKTDIVKVATSDGHNVILLEPLVYVTDAGETIEVPVGASADGCSTPSQIWSIIPPFGTYWRAAILHDYLYRKTQRPRSECDLLFLEAMKSLGVNLLLRETIYHGVQIGGNWAFDEDRKLKLLRIVNPGRVSVAQPALDPAAVLAETAPAALTANAGAPPIRE